MAGVELATAYISIIPETSKIAPGINKALGQAESGAAQSGQRAGSSFAGGLGKGLAMLGGTAALAGVFKSVINTGNDFTNSLNTMQAVSRATADQMAAVSQRAKDLGNDMSLPNTSASDAAAAMTELAKGGFDVSQSMQAAKGTLQLAAAAQISAADAATIQSQALQSFGQNADYASTAADILANTANASSAEIGDVANGLQQSGTVAHSFGINMQDTATALGLFANAGITGSDAGTLLKTSLLALTDQGNPAQGAIEDLGLAVYDASGNFVGLESLFGQLQTASKRMTPEMYQAATTTLFGSDAARLAGVAAQQGAAGFDTMRDAVGRQGAAAEVAAAKTQGLPGAMAAVQNSVETLSLGFYDLVKGPLQSFATSTASFVSDNTPAFLGALSGIGGALSAIPGPVVAIGAALASWKLLGMAERLAPVTAGLRDFADRTGKLQAVASGGGQNIGKISAAFGTLNGKIGGVKGALSGLTNALGGGAFLGVAAASTAVGLIVSSALQTKQAIEGIKESTVQGDKALLSYQEQIAKTGGIIDETAKGIATASVNFDIQKALGLNDIGGFDKAVYESGKAVRDFLHISVSGEGPGSKFIEAKDKADALKTAMNDMKLSVDDAGAVVSKGGPRYDDLIHRLEGAGDAGKAMAQNLKDARKEIDDATFAAQHSSPGFLTLENALKVIADDASTADEKLAAFQTTLDILSGKPVDITKAMAGWHDVMRQVNEDLVTGVDKSKGFGDALFVGVGKINDMTDNGAKLRDTMGDMRNQFIEAALAGAPLNELWADNSKTLDTLAAQYGVNRTALEQVQVQMGMTPRLIETTLALQGGGDTKATLQAIQDMLQATGKPVEIPVNADTQPALDVLKSLDIKIDTTTHPGAAIIDGDPTKINAVLDDVIARQIPDKSVVIKPNVSEYDQIMGIIAQPITKTVNISTQAGTGGAGDILGLTPTGRAAGGPITGGTPGKDSVLIAGMPGEHMLTVDDVNALGGQAGVYAFRNALHMAAGGAVPKGVADAAAAARSVTGNPYVWGGSGPTGFDCSGFMGWLQQILMGQPSNRRLYTTNSLLGGSGAGLQPGAGPAGTWFQVGVNTEHMAGTLGGQPVEAGGSHDTSRIGSPAVGASNGQFTNMYYLPTALIVGGQGTAYTAATAAPVSDWSDQDELDLERARIGVDEAQKKQNELAADATELDRRQAAIDVREAQNRAAELEQKKAGKPTSPEAPGLETKYTDEQIELERARLAVESARLSRNDVYADATKTSDDRLTADLELASAQNAYSDKLSGKGTSGGPMGTKERLKKLGSDLVGVGIDAAMEQLPFGIGASRWWDVPTSFPKAETDRQLPVTTGGDPGALAPYIDGAPEWVKRLIGDMAIYDDGGWLKPGGIAVNLGKKPEPIFNSPAQLAEFAGAAFPASNTPGLNIENVRGYDPQAVAREVMKQFRFEQMRHTGRPMVTS